MFSLDWQSRLSLFLPFSSVSLLPWLRHYWPNVSLTVLCNDEDLPWEDLIILHTTKERVWWYSFTWWDPLRQEVLDSHYGTCKGNCESAGTPWACNTFPESTFRWFKGLPKAEISNSLWWLAIWSSVLCGFKMLLISYIQSRREKLSRPYVINLFKCLRATVGACQMLM